jgi:hypothetical protein
MQRMHLGADACRELFAGRPNLCRAVGFAWTGQSDHLVRVPPVRWFSDAWVLCAEMLEQSAARSALRRLAPLQP